MLREVERQVMLRIIDQRWREHLEEMDYLQEGINLRAMGQKDPLTEWQREGYEMFGAMMKGIAQDFVRYVMHVQVVQQQEQAPTLRRAERPRQQTSSDDDAATRPGSIVPAASAVAEGDLPRRRPRRRRRSTKQPTVVKDDFVEDAAQRARARAGRARSSSMCHGAA